MSEPGPDDHASEPADAVLLSAWQSGDTDAGNALVARHFLAVYRFFASKVPRDCEDLTQRTFEKLHASVADGTRITSLRAYLMTIARNALYEQLRRGTAHDRVFDPNADSIVALGDGPSVGRILAGRREARLLLDALRRIPVEAQIVLELYYWEELAVREIADVVGIRPGTVMSRLARARRRLEKVMSELDADEALVRSTLAGLGEWAAELRDAMKDEDGGSGGNG